MENARTVLITGGARGIGLQISKDFAKAGYNVCINYNTSKTEAEILKSKLEQDGAIVSIYQADISNEEEVAHMITSILKEYSQIDVLVNNAGLAMMELFQDSQKDKIDKIININIYGNIFVTKEVISKSMLPNKKGNIINISSMWGQVGASCESIYSGTKGFIDSLSKSLAKELAPSNIRVNVVSPGVIETDMISMLSKEDKDALKEETPLNRIGTPKDVSNLVTFLASDNADNITGQVFCTNGGSVI